MARGKPTATPGAEQAARPSARPAIPEGLSRRVIVEHIHPEVDAGRFPIKRSVGESVDVTARIFADGHDVIVAILRDRQATAEHAELSSLNNKNSAGLASSAVAPLWRETPMAITAPGTDKWGGSFDVAAIGWHEYQILAWVDRFLTWRR